MANITDTKNTPVKTIVTATALGSSHPVAEFAEAGHKVNTDIRSADGGKRLGRIQIALTAAVPSMLIATGGRPVDLWSDTINADITPAYTPAFPLPTVGVGSDLKPNFNTTLHDDCGIASVPFPVVTEAALVDLGHIVNYYEYSGKKTGSVVLVYVGIVLTYAISTGGLPSSTWRLADGTVITPVGTLRSSTSTDAGDFKPTVANTNWINAIDFPVVYAGDLGSLSYPAIYNDEQPVHRHSEHQVIAISGGVLHLMYSQLAAGVLTWYDLGDVLTAIVVNTTVSGSIITAAGTTTVPAVARVLNYCPSGTAVALDITGNVSGLQQLAFVTTKDLSVIEMAAEVALQAQVLTDAVITSLGEDVLILAGGVDATLTINVFTLT